MRTLLQLFEPLRLELRAVRLCHVLFRNMYIRLGDGATLTRKVFAEVGCLVSNYLTNSLGINDRRLADHLTLTFFSTQMSNSGGC